MAEEKSNLEQFIEASGNEHQYGFICVKTKVGDPVTIRIDEEAAEVLKLKFTEESELPLPQAVGFFKEIVHAVGIMMMYELVGYAVRNQLQKTSQGLKGKVVNPGGKIIH